MEHKPIYLDGVNVSGCTYSKIGIDKKCYCEQDLYDDGTPVFTCDECTDCYYKQLKRKEQECERLKWYLKEIRYDELKALDIEWDEYETHCIDSEYSNIINLVEEALKERSSEDCRYDR